MKVKGIRLSEIIFIIIPGIGGVVLGVAAFIIGITQGNLLGAIISLFGTWTVTFAWVVVLGTFASMDHD